MKHIISTVTLALFITLCTGAYAEAASDNACQQKEQAIMREIEIAKQHNNRGRVSGLERALANVRLWCSDDGLLSRADDKIEEKREKVQEREEELAEAVADGKGQDKISKRTQKLEEAKSELREAIAERDALLESMMNQTSQTGE